jgi:hypothetical protein
MTYSAGMTTAAAGVSVLAFFAVRVELPATLVLPAKTLCLLDGSGVLTWGGHTYVGADPDYGSWGGFDPISEQSGGQAVRFRTSFMTVSDLAIQQMAQPESQGAPIVISYGFVSVATGLPVSDPEIEFAGILDFGKLSNGADTKNLMMEACDAYELLFQANDGATLSSAYHNLWFPAEKGFEFVDNVTHQIPWGQSGPRPDQVTNIDNFDVGPGLPATNLKF